MLLELSANDVQPARFEFPVSLRATRRKFSLGNLQVHVTPALGDTPPALIGGPKTTSGARGESGDPRIAGTPPDLNYRFPIIILGLVSGKFQYQ